MIFANHHKKSEKSCKIRKAKRIIKIKGKGIDGKNEKIKIYFNVSPTSLCSSRL